MFQEPTWNFVWKIRSSSIHNVDLTGHEHRKDKLIVGIDTEKFSEAGFTRLDTRARDLMTIMIEFKSHGIANRRD